MKHFKLGLVLLIALAVMGTALQGAIPSAQRQALIDLYNATNGDSWNLRTGWKAAPLHTDGFALPGTEGTWRGVTVIGDTVTNIILNGNNLVGTLPASIGDLTGLLSLNLHTNQLSGTIPASLGNLTSLLILHLYENAFTGSLPSSLGNLTHVTQFDAYTNQLSGEIPASLGSMAALQQLNLYSNAFTGALPSELGNLSALQLLDAHGNQLSGALPASFGNLTNLTQLLLSGNLLTGSIPTEWGGMAALQALYLDNNLLSGTVPASLGSLTHLVGLKLNDNGLTGSIPSALGNLTSLTTLDLSRNHFDGTIPTELGNLTVLQNLALYSNKLAGPVPTSLANLTSLSTTETAIGYNALYTTDETLLAFLNAKDADWAATQTVAPASVTATALDNAVILVSWLPITYTNHTGGYKVYISQTSGGGYTLAGQTADKTVAALQVTGLTPGTRYYFVVRTQTNEHTINPNIVESATSAEATAVAWTLVSVHVTGTVLSGTSPLAGVAMTGLPGNPVTNASGVYDGTVPADWSGTVTPAMAGTTFTPASRSYTSLTTNQTGQDYTAAFVSYPDRQALTDLYNATGGDSWTANTGWKTAPLYADGFAMPGTEGTWIGVTVDGGTQRVTQISLSSNNLTGTIPASLGVLTSLQSLNLNSNHLSGTIPATLGNLTSLQSLQMVTNQLSGAIPVEIGNLTNLQALFLSENQLSGTIPSGLGALTGLQDINIYSNNLTGSIPAQLGSLTNLVSLYLNRNQLTGSIPTELGNLANLQVLSLYNNQLSGTIPTQLGNMTALRTLHLQGNQLTGSIPASLGDLAQLQVLALQANQLSGALPSSLGSLTNLQQLSINSNMLVGTIPTSLADLVNLTTTDIGFNGLHTSDAALIAFLNAKDSNWYETQTIPPSGMTATALNGAHVLVSWVPISYTSATGGYKVLSSQTAGGPYSFVAQTTDKTATSLEVAGLSPGETYYFIVQTHTDAHAANANAVDSDSSAEVSATAWTQVTVRVTGTVTLGSAPLAGVVMAGLTGNPTTDALGVYDVTVGAGWSGTVTPTLSGYSFTPVSRPYTGLTTDQTGQDYAAAYVPIPDRQVLIELYNATNGDNWSDNSGWKTPPLYGDGFALPGTEGTWYGINKNGVVTGINLSANNLVGTLPASLGSLTSMVSLNLHTNQLSGTVPASLGNLTNLTVLHLYENAFTGTLPSTLGNLIHLTQLNVHYNQLSGEIPASLATMSSLRELRLYNNAFTGALPTELGNLATLQILDGHANQLSGALPVSLGSLTNLTDLLLSGNLLTGSIPTEFGGMSAMQLLQLGNNQLSGSIPTSLGSLTHLTGLKLDDNGLTGSIPSSLGNLTSLTTLDLSRNHFDGTIPTELGNLTVLQNLALYSNKLAGPVPTSLANLTNLSTTETAIGYNALYTTDETLLAFLNAKDADWAATQTVAPASVTATALDNAVILVSWLPITYTNHTGGYKVYISQTSGGGYTLAGQTVDKTVAALQVTGLTPGTRYYFVVRTQTNEHTINPNIVESATSAEATAVAWTLVSVHVTGTVLSGTSPLAGVAMTGLPGNPVTNASGVYDGTVPADWSGTVTPAMAGTTFTPASRSYTSLTTDQTGQDYTAAFVSYPDRQALTDLYNATGGDSWTANAGWKTPPLYADGFAMPGTEGTWFGVTVDGGTQRVIQISLSSNNLTGTVPASLANLSSLAGLDLSLNHLGGSIPVSLGALISLQTLSLNGNNLTGSVPASLGNLTELRQLWLSSNQLSGTIPAGLGNLASLQQLWLNHNQLTGTIPAALGGLTGIQYMSLSNNLLTGAIPSELGSLANALYLYLQSNQLNGTIPTTLGSLTSLTQLLLNNNQLTGSIPSSLGDLIQLRVLALQANQLSGAIPSSLGSLTNLQQLSINSNMLAGPIPTTLTNLVNLAEGQTDIGFNGLYTSDAALIAFLSVKDPNWYETQTIAPAGMTATALNGANILVSWIPISYTSGAGYYKVSISQTAGGPYTLVGQTTDKTATSLQVSGLTPGETYYFVVQTHTDAHPANTNPIDSNNSSEVSATAWTQVSIRVTGTVTLGSAPLAGVVMSGLTGNPATDALGVYDVTLSAGWSGTVTPTLSGYSFTPASRTYTGLTTDQTGQDYAAAYVAIPARQVLIDLYNATNGDNWTNKDGWKTPPLYGDGFALPGTEGTWHGVTIAGGLVTVINESSNNLVGTLPASLGSLSGLESLNLHTNQLSGTIPDSLGNLTNLIVMHLYENSLTGTLPATLGNLTHLLQLNVNYNQLSGEIPASLGTMSSLRELRLYSNAFTGALPTELGNLTTLQVLDAHTNQFSGALPVSLGNLTNLTDLLLNANQLTGSIPTEWGGMSALQYLYLNNNQLSGTLPASLGGLSHLIGLKLNENGLTGSIPSALGGLTVLTTLDLSRNHFDGAIPTELGNLTALTNLYLFANKLAGPAPTSLANLTNLNASETALGYNALFTTDEPLLTFLNSKDYDWTWTQTVAPSQVTATSLDNAVILVSWMPIDFVDYSGAYKLYMSETPGGPYSLVGQTGDKTVTSLQVTSLTPGTRYYFVVRTQSNANTANTNIIESADSAEATAVASLHANVHVTGTVLAGAVPLAGVVMSGLNGSPVTNASGVYDGLIPAGWSGTVTPTLAGYTFVPASRDYVSLTADQTAQDYAATASATYTMFITSVNGTVAKAPDQTTYNAGTPVQLTATPSAGYHFVNWTGDASGSANPTTVVMDGDKVVVAHFSINTYTLTYTAGAGGTITGTTPQTVDHGTSGTAVTAVASAGYHFVNWSDSSTANPRTDANVTANISVTANFAINTYSLTVNAVNGTVVKVPDQASYDHGTVVQLTPTPAEGYQFVNWTGDATGSVVPLAVTMDGVKTITANFAIITYALTVNAVNGTVVKVPDQASYDHGTVVQLTPTPAEGYQFVNWTGDATGSVVPLAVTMDGVKTITANFALNTYTLTYTAGAGGTITGTTPQTVEYGADGAEVMAVADPHYHFVNWSDGVLTPARTDLNVTGNISVIANFAIDTHTLAITAVNGTVTKDPDQATFDYGTTVQLTAVPSAGYHFVNWAGDASGSANPVTVTMDGNKAVTANFAIDSIPVTERAALIAFYDATNGNSWTINSGWQTPPLHTDGFAMPGTEGTWFGIGIDAGSLRVTSIDLSNNNLAGVIAPELGSLSSLNFLRLSSNPLGGAIPAEIGNLGNLTSIFLDGTQVGGAIPPELGNLHSLTQLYLSTGLMTGSIPTEFGNLSNLVTLNLHGNQLGGGIPASLGNLTNLQSIELSANQLTGDIPSSLGNLANLMSLRLSSNLLSGPIPAELGNLDNLTELLLQMNDLTGSIPTELGGMASLQNLGLNHNELTGPIPASFGSLATLRYLSLEYNHLSGQIPSQLGSLVNLQTLTLHANQLTGAIPSELGNLTSLLALYLNSNMLSGTIPASLAGLSNVTALDTGYNSLVATDPDLVAFLNAKNPTWASTQTIAPTGVTATSLENAEILVSWLPIAYTGDTGSYKVLISGTAGGPYTLAGATANKTTSSVNVTGLTPGQRYYFVVQTHTNAHANNQSALDSENSTEATAIAWTQLNVHISGTVQVGGSPLAGVVMNGLTGSPVTDALGVYSGTEAVDWSGTVTPVLAGYTFAPLSRTYSHIAADQTAQDYAATLLTYTISGTVTLDSAPLAGVVMTGLSGSPVTNAAGGYAATVNYSSSFTVTPTLDGYTFAPSFRSYTSVMADHLADDYTAAAVLVPTITVISPNGGETWAAGSTHDIIWSQTGLTGTVTIDLYKGGVYQKTLGTPDATAGAFSWVIATNEAVGTDYRVLVWQGSVSDESNADFEIDAAAIRKDDLLGTWDGQGVYYLNSDDGGWYLMSSPATMITSGDLDGDGTDDLIGIWPSQGGVWVKYSTTGDWAYIASDAQYISTGDMNGDGRVDLLGNWIGQGVYYRDSMTGFWVLMASEASMIASGDLDGDGTDDLIGIWPSQGGVWVKYSTTGEWAYVASDAQYISSGDMNGDGREDLLGNWIGQGVYYRDSITGTWVLMASEASMIASGDLDGDGIDDLLGIWPSQGGVWVKYSTTGGWQLLSSTAQYIATGKMRPVSEPEAQAQDLGLPLPMGGTAAGPDSALKRIDESASGPGGFRFVYITEKDLTPQEKSSARLMRIPGPGEPMFSPQTQANIIPRNPETRKTPDRRKEKIY